MSPKLEPLPTEHYKQLLAKEERHQTFGAEITKISLAGIALLGFFVQYVRDKCIFDSEATMLHLLGASAVAFSLSTAFALSHLYFSTQGFTLRVRQIQYQLHKETLPPSNKHKVEMDTAASGAARNFNRSSFAFGAAVMFCTIGAALVVAAIVLATWFDGSAVKKVCTKEQRTGALVKPSAEVAVSGLSISRDPTQFRLAVSKVA